MSITKSAKELRPGDVLLSPWREIILSVTLEPQKGEFWTTPHVDFFDLNDSYYGPCSRELKLNDTFEIADDRKTIVDAFETVSCDLSTYIAEHLNWKKELDDIFNKIITKLNKRDRKK